MSDYGRQIQVLSDRLAESEARTRRLAMVVIALVLLVLFPPLAILVGGIVGLALAFALPVLFIALVIHLLDRWFPSRAAPPGDPNRADAAP
jgi:predicted MFS family arabinose efflux permease